MCNDNYDSRILNYNKDDALLRLKMLVRLTMRMVNVSCVPLEHFPFHSQVPYIEVFAMWKAARRLTTVRFLASQLNPIWLASQIE